MEISSLKREPKSDANQTARLSELGQKIDDLAKRLHTTSRLLHPAVLEDLGLEPALRQECESFQSAYKIPTDFSANNVPANIPLAVALCLYRVVQESLRNVWKHAKDTDKVWVSLTGSPDGITLTVKDQGDGFELDAALRKGGLGLISMDERVRAESGKLTVQSKPGDGTVVPRSFHSRMQSWKALSRGRTEGNAITSLNCRRSPGSLGRPAADSGPSRV